VLINLAKTHTPVVDQTIPCQSGLAGNSNQINELGGKVNFFLSNPQKMTYL
jgi:hypothetical protein